GGSESSRHLGVDFAVVKGTPVRAAARGRVVFAAERIVTGTTVVIEHLPGLYSIYMHLSSASVAAGRLVERGEVVALSGNSGLSTGPHLHWELRALGRSVDPEAWVKAAPLDKARLIAIMDAAIEGR
ncbi:MAG TPA: M23 family metallopeptidase, partial [Spirochaetales bacterium]|nr:M23 family metallopeptidase [Spirochaetales bacterium]